MMSHADRARKRGPVVSEAEFRRLWADLTISVEEIGRRLGISGNAVRQRADVRGFAPRPRGRPFARRCDHDQIVELYLSGLSMPKIAVRLGVTGNNVLMALRRAGIPSRDRKAGAGTGSLTRVAFGPDFDFLWQSGVRTADMAALYGCDPATVRDEAARRGHPPRAHCRARPRLGDLAEWRLRRAMAASAAEEQAALRLAEMVDGERTPRRPAKRRAA